MQIPYPVSRSKIMSYIIAKKGGGCLWIVANIAIRGGTNGIVLINIVFFNVEGKTIFAMSMNFVYN